MEYQFNEDGSYETRGTAYLPTGPKPYKVTGTWRVDSTNLYETATNAVPQGFPLNQEDRIALLAVSETECSMRSDDGTVRAFRKKN